MWKIWAVLSCDPRLSPLQRNRSARVREHAASIAIRKDFFKHWQPVLTAAQFLQRRGTLWCQTPMRLHKAGEGESTAKAWLAITLISANEPSECFQALSISSWRQQASIRSQTRGVQVKSRGRHKTQGVWQQLNPLIRNRLLLLLSADGQTSIMARLRRQFLKGRDAEGFFPITFKSCLQIFIKDSHPSWTPHPITVFTCWWFSDSTKKYTLVLNVMSLSILSCSAQNIIESTTRKFQSSPALPLCYFSCILGMAALKGFLIPLLTTISQTTYSSESFTCRFQISIARKNLPYISMRPKLLNPINSLACAFRKITRSLDKVGFFCF